jgi:hypothetical protein
MTQVDELCHVLIQTQDGSESDQVQLVKVGQCLAVDAGTSSPEHDLVCVRLDQSQVFMVGLIGRRSPGKLKIRGNAWAHLRAGSGRPARWGHRQSSGRGSSSSAIRLRIRVLICCQAEAKHPDIEVNGGIQVSRKSQAALKYAPGCRAWSCAGQHAARLLAHPGAARQRRARA